jgi:uncharacterized protein YcbK (DUF882 family)
LFFDEPVIAGQGNNSKQVLTRLLGVVVACGLAASCSTSSDFVTAMGFTQLAEQGSETLSNGETTEVASVEPGDAPEVSETASSAVLAYAHPTARPAPLAAESVEPTDVAAKETAETAPATAQQVPVQNEAVVVGVEANEPNAPAESADVVAAEASPAKKRGFLSSIFGARSEKPEQEQASKPAAEPIEAAHVAAAQKLNTSAVEEPKPTIDAAAISAAYSANVLPGVRGNNQLFEIRSANSADDESDVDLYEEEGSYQVASAVGLARLAPHGLLKQREDVDTSCFKPQLVRLLKVIEGHYRKPVLVTSGYRSPAHNRRVRGARKSAHMDCAAADIQVAGVSRWELAKFARSLPGRGGVGTYCHTSSVHVDVGRERDWNWRCRK